MSHFIFLVKQVIKQKTTWIPLCLLFLAISIPPFLNHSASLERSLGTQIRNNIQQNAENIYTLEQEITTQQDSESEKASYLEKNLVDSKKQIEQDKIFLNEFNNEEWKNVYLKQIDNIKRSQKSTSYAEPSKDLNNALDRDLKLYETLAKKTIPFEDVNYPYTGIQYTLSLFLYIFPVLLSISILFILSNLYGSFFHEDINKMDLLPQKKAITHSKNLISGFVIACSFLVCSLLVAFLITTIPFKMGSFNYPVLHYNLTSHTIYFAEVKKTILPTLSLELLMIIFLVCLTYLLALVFKNKLTTLLLSSIILFGSMFLVNIIQPIQENAQYLPMTYIYCYDITTGIYQYNIDNFYISFIMGIKVLLFSITMMLCFIFYPKNRKKLVK